jgi:hypothetical protein
VACCYVFATPSGFVQPSCDGSHVMLNPYRRLALVSVLERDGGT